MQTEKQRGIKPRKEEDNDAIRSEEGHQPFSCFRSLSSQNRWNYIVCAKCPKVNMCCDIFSPVVVQSSFTVFTPT